MYSQHSLALMTMHSHLCHNTVVPLGENSASLHYEASSAGIEGFNPTIHKMCSLSYIPLFKCRMRGFPSLPYYYRYGLVPNGGRQYYTRRSQPPLLTQMVELFYNRTENTTFLHNLLPALVTEYNFWVNNRSIPFFGPAYTAPTDTPRWTSLRWCWGGLTAACFFLQTRSLQRRSRSS